MPSPVPPPVKRTPKEKALPGHATGKGSRIGSTLPPRRPCKFVIVALNCQPKRGGVQYVAGVRLRTRFWTGEAPVRHDARMGLFASEEELLRRRATKEDRLREMVAREVAAQLSRQLHLPPPPGHTPGPGTDPEPRLSPEQLDELLPPADTIVARQRPSFTLRVPPSYSRAIELLAKDSGRSQNALGCGWLRDALDRELAAYEERNGHLPADWLKTGDPDAAPDWGDGEDEDG
mgnify:FL=1